MDKKKILFATLFLAIMLLVPFTAVASQTIDYTREKEFEKESIQEIEASNPYRPICLILYKLKHRFADKFNEWSDKCRDNYRPGSLSCTMAIIYHNWKEIVAKAYSDFGCEDCV